MEDLDILQVNFLLSPQGPARGLCKRVSCVEMDQNTSSLIAFIGIATSIATSIYVALKHSKCHSRCCGRNMDMEIDLTPPPLQIKKPTLDIDESRGTSPTNASAKEGEIHSV